jgi:hypothetical protein
MMNLILREVERLEVKAPGVTQGLVVTGFRPSAGSYGVARLGQQNISDFGGVTQPRIQSVLPPRDRGGITRTRNSNGRPWSTSTFVHEATGDAAQAAATTFRHEFGHNLTIRFAEDGPLAGQVEAAFQRVRALGLDWFDQHLTQYGASKWTETIAEVFAVVTGPGYVQGQLPRTVEALVDLMLRNGVAQNARRARGLSGDAGLFRDMMAPPPGFKVVRDDSLQSLYDIQDLEEVEPTLIPDIDAQLEGAGVLTPGSSTEEP